MSSVPRLAASTYLNSAPIVYAFVEGSQAHRVDIAPDPAPSVCARLLASGLVDGALIPSVEYQRIPGLSVANGVCVAARRSVRSVLLISRTPLDAIRSVALDEQSRTSAALVRLLLGRFRGLLPTYDHAAPDLEAMLAAHDAALLIGDTALLADTTGCEVYDLAELWRDATGLPFVFAVWAVRPDRVDRAFVDFVAAMREGVAAIPSIAERYAARLGRDRDDLVGYLTENIHFELDDESLEGLDLFYRLAAEEGLVPSAQPLRFWPGP